MNILRKIGLFFGINLFGLCAGLLLFEGAFRVFWSSGASGPSWNDRPSSFYKPQEAENFQGNSYKLPKPGNVWRMAVLGDSFTFATSMQFDDAFPARLDRMLNLNKTEEKAEVINYGVPGFSTSHEVAAARKALKEGADLVVLQITLNDPQIKQYVPSRITGKNDFGPYKAPEYLDGVLDLFSSVEALLRQLHNKNTKTRYIEYYHNLFEHKPTRRSFRLGLKRIKALCKKKRVPLVAVVFPLFGLPINDEYPFADIHEFIGEQLTRLRVPYLDLTDIFKGVPLSRIQVVPGQDFHPNELGHRMSAEAIYDWLVKEGRIPPQFVIREHASTRYGL